MIISASMEKGEPMSKDEIIDYLEEALAELYSWARDCGDKPNINYAKAIRYAIAVIVGERRSDDN